MNRERKFNYKKTVAELDGIIRSIQSEQCDIDELGDKTKKALELIKLCKEKLTQTDEELKKILAESEDE